MMTTAALPTTTEGELVERAPPQLELEALPTDELHERLRAAIGMTAETIQTMAGLWRELVRRGEDMSQYRNALAPFLMSVAEGRLLPAMVVQLSGQTRALERIAELPVSEQERLLNDSPIEIYRGEGRTDAVLLRDMLFRDVALAVRDGRILSASEQKLAFERSLSRRPRPTRRGRPPRISITDDNQLRIGKMTVDAERVIAALRAHDLIN